MSQDATNNKVVSIAGRRGRRYPFYTDTELAAMPAPSAAIEGMLYGDTLATIVAEYESFKTFVALEMSFCMAIGAEYYGRAAVQGVVLYLTAEGRHGIYRRIAALRAKYGYTAELPVIVHTGSVDICNPVEVATALADANHKLQEMAFAHEPIVAIFVDTLARNMVGDENRAEDMNRFVAGCDQLRTHTGACVVAVHHTGWAQEGKKQRSRGSIVLPSAVDTEITLTRDNERVTLKCTKQKDADRFADLTLEMVPMAGSLVPEAVEPRSPKLSGNERRALTEVQSEPGLKWGEWELATDLAKGSLHRAKSRLLDLSYLKQSGGYFVATAAGKLAIGSKFSVGSTEVQR